MNAAIELNEQDAGCLAGLAAILDAEPESILKAIVSRAIRHEYLLRNDIDLAAAVRQVPKRVTKKAAFVLPEWFDEQITAAWGEYLAHRRNKIAPLNAYGQSRAVKKLESLRDEGHDPAKVLRLSVSENWTGLHGKKDTRAAASSVNFKAML